MWCSEGAASLHDVTPGCTEYPDCPHGSMGAAHGCNAGQRHMPAGLHGMLWLDANKGKCIAPPVPVYRRYSEGEQFW